MKTTIKRIFLLTFAALIFTSAQSFGQSIGYDTTFRPNGYKARIAKFETEPISKKDYVFLGNSITAGTDWSTLLNLPNAKNRGISGDITFGVLDQA